MSDNTKMLGFYSVASGNEIHVIDTDPFSLSRGGGLTDVSLIEKYKMDDEVYEKRSGTMREFIREQRKKDPNFKLTPKTGPGAMKPSGDVVATNQPPPGPESVAGVEVGMRCELTPGARRGTVRFVGEIPEIKAGGYWVRLLCLPFLLHVHATS
jgi:tubulin-folding cofactor B